MPDEGKGIIRDQSGITITKSEIAAKPYVLRNKNGVILRDKNGNILIKSKIASKTDVLRDNDGMILSENTNNVFLKTPDTNILSPSEKNIAIPPIEPNNSNVSTAIPKQITAVSPQLTNHENSKTEKVNPNNKPQENTEPCFTYVPKTRNLTRDLDNEEIMTVDYIDTYFECNKSAEEVLDMFETQGLLVTKTNYPFVHLPEGAQQITSEARSTGIIKKQKKDKDSVCTTFVQNGLNVPLFTRTPLGIIMNPDNISQTLLIGKIDILSHDNDKESKLDEVEQTIKYDQITGAKLDDPWINKDDKV